MTNTNFSTIVEQARKISISEKKSRGKFKISKRSLKFVPEWACNGHDIVSLDKAKKQYRIGSIFYIDCIFKFGKFTGVKTWSGYDFCDNFGRGEWKDDITTTSAFFRYTNVENINVDYKDLSMVI